MSLKFGALTVLVSGSAADPWLVNPCLEANSPWAKQPWCDATLPLDQRVEDMVKRMTLQEKIGSLDTTSPAIASLGLPAYNWWSEATHGLSHIRNDDGTPYETNFAFPITTAMSFNRTLWYSTGAQIGREARAFMNAGNAYSTYWAPVINLAREPRWGRNIETPGEDPYLTGEYATAFVQGFEQSPDDPHHIQASACCKHYAANSMEGTTEANATWTRHNFNADVSMQDLVDSYLLPFQACVEKGKVSGLMCSYNSINGVPSCANDWLLTTVARDSWGFDGYITSDCDADEDVFSSHHYTATPEETVRDVLRAGTDVDCTSFVGSHAKSALDKGLITEADIDERLRKLFKVRMRLSHFDPVGPLDKIPRSDICSEHATALARDGVVQGSTLLKNVAGALPLDAAKLRTVAVLGPNTNISQKMAGYYGGNNCDGKFWNMGDAVKQYVPNTLTQSNGNGGLEAAGNMAQDADAVVLALGTNLDDAREGHDATSISLPEAQVQLVETVAAKAHGPIIVVMLTAVPLDISKLLANPKVSAILHVGQPSVQTLGIGDVLFGKSVPAGRTIQTVYPASYADQISIFDFNMRPGPSKWPRPDCPREQWGHCPMGTNPGRTHRFYTGKAVIPFGFGLSYTTFKYSMATAPTSVSLNTLREQLATVQRGGKYPKMADIEAAGPAVQYAVSVTNTGDVDADDAVLGFLTPPGAGKDGVPLQTLFGFERVHVKAGETVTVWLYPSLADFTHVDLAGTRHALPGAYKVHFGVQETAVHGMGYVATSLVAHLDDVPELVV
eukprot:gb/GFBE01063890.1/.p1 GENE.gb/GFBE01063890.1/~~gb/GFBE01063890.1/.p1  ORF type:complete len:787 (+),score=165.40 gb/GFBE01063890.1/:1-2361(+)